jgi:hypothetical protein
MELLFRILLPPSSGKEKYHFYPEDGGSKFIQNVCTHLPPRYTPEDYNIYRCENFRIMKLRYLTPCSDGACGAWRRNATHS